MAFPQCRRDPGDRELEKTYGPLLGAGLLPYGMSTAACDGTCHLLASGLGPLPPEDSGILVVGEEGVTRELHLARHAVGGCAGVFRLSGSAMQAI